MSLKSHLGLFIQASCTFCKRISRSHSGQKHTIYKHLRRASDQGPNTKHNLQPRIRRPRHSTSTDSNPQPVTPAHALLCCSMTSVTNMQHFKKLPSSTSDAGASQPTGKSGLVARMIALYLKPDQMKEPLSTLPRPTSEAKPLTPKSSSSAPLLAPIQKCIKVDPNVHTDASTRVQDFAVFPRDARRVFKPEPMKCSQLHRPSALLSTEPLTNCPPHKYPINSQGDIDTTQDVKLIPWMIHPQYRLDVRDYPEFARNAHRFFKPKPKIDSVDHLDHRPRPIRQSLK